jgi:dephospho-CoA kinase
MDKHPYSRKLDNIDLIEHFLNTVLEYDDSQNDNLLKDILSGEAGIKNYVDSNSTFLSSDNRSRKYKEDNSRWQLRKQIVKELFENEREEKDDDISLGRGGALPKNGINSDSQAFIIIGLPASGKSSIANQIADHYGAIILDSDYAKRKLPEFENNTAGASIVHEESDFLIFGKKVNKIPEDFNPLIKLCSENKYNIVIPKIGHNAKSINDLSKGLKLLGYKSHLICVSLDRKDATKRAVNRFKDSKRYVPLSLIFDGYGNDSILTFYRLKDKIDFDEVHIETFGKLSTDVPKDEKPRVLYSENDNPVLIFK